MKVIFKGDGRYESINTAARGYEPSIHGRFNLVGTNYSATVEFEGSEDAEQIATTIKAMNHRKLRITIETVDDNTPEGIIADLRRAMDLGDKAMINIILEGLKDAKS